MGYKPENPFSTEERETIHMRWYITNRFTGDKQYTAGYGGLAIYEVSIGQSSIYDWYKYHEEPSHEHGSP